MLYTKSGVLLVLSVVAAVWSSVSLGYGGGGTGDSCDKPEFSSMTPPKGTLVSPGAEFSFVASANTTPRSIRVSAKGIEIDAKLEKNEASGKIRVRGVLPAELVDGHVLIKINASSSGSCSAQGGWLLKIGNG